MSFLIAAGNGREASRRRAMIMPGSRFSCVADVRDNDRIPTMRDVMPRGVNPAMGDPVKAAVTLFIADFINTIMRDSMPDEIMFDYCDTMLDFYAVNTSGRANFHLLFLLKMARFSGIEPDTSTYRDGYIFDMIDGIFRSSAPLHGRFLERDEARAAVSLLRMNTHNLHLWKLTSEQRNTILDRIMEYYSLHFSNIQSMKSLEILRTLFH